MPRLAAFHLVGASALGAGEIHEVLDPLVIGELYTERRFRTYLDANLLPRYGDLGRLVASFPQIEATTPAEPGGDLEATVTIQEGEEYRLRAVELRGEAEDVDTLLEAAKFPIGKRANVSKIQEGFEAILVELSRDGYLAARLQPRRTLDASSKEAAWTLDIRRGPQFVFGELLLSGVGPKQEKVARKRWKLASGDPMDKPYISEYLNKVMPAIQAGGVALDLQIRPQSNIADVAIKFR